MDDLLERCSFYKKGDGSEDVIGVYSLPEGNFLVAETNGDDPAEVMVSKHPASFYRREERLDYNIPLYALKQRRSGTWVLVREEPENECERVEAENVPEGKKQAVGNALAYWVQCFDYPSGKMLYKYYSPQKYNFDAVENGDFFFSKAFKLNDPFDTSLELAQPFTKFMERIKGRLDSNAKRIMDEYGVCAFSEIRDNKHLWALYADSYKGFVVGYDKERLDTLSGLLSMRCPLRPVIYRDELFDLDDYDSSFSLLVDDEIQTHTVREAFGDGKTMDKLWEYLCLTKEKAIWQNEKEWRYFAGMDVLTRQDGRIEKEVNGYKLPIPEGAVKEIIVGHNMEEKNFSYVCAIVRKYGLNKILKTKPVVRDRKFEVEFVELACKCWQDNN